MTRTILTVDDEEQVRQVLGSLLSSRGYRVLEADCGERALEIATANDVSLVITDLRMPGMDGLTLAGKLLAQDPDRPVIILTGHSEPAIVRKAAEIGVHGYHTKPFRFREILAAVESACGERPTPPAPSAA